jgi:5'-3' exonuclease
MKYVLIDTANLFFRARHGAFRASDTWEKVGFALHVTLMAANKMARRFEADHVVFALEGRSWRKDFYKPYKANRTVAKQALTEAEQEEDQMFWDTYDALTTFLNEKTNCSVIRCPTAEGDDIIARWIALHPQDDHVIISSDTDYLQLITPKVKQYNGVAGHLITLEGYFDDKGKPVKDKEKNIKLLEDPQYLLFKKCMRGDGTDNVFSAYPGVREKGSQKKAGLIEAYADRTNCWRTICWRF